MKLRRWIVGAGEVASFRDEADYREYAQGDAVVLLSEGRPALAWNCWVPGSVWMPVRGQARLFGRDLRLTLATDQLLVAEQGNRLFVAGLPEALPHPALVYGNLERFLAEEARETAVTWTEPKPHVISS